LFTCFLPYKSTNTDTPAARLKVWYVNHACNVDWESTGDIRDVRISIARRYSVDLLCSYKSTDTDT
jgi:hypothetical protein